MHVPENIGLHRIQAHRMRFAQPVTPILARHAGIVDRPGDDLVRLAIAHELAARNGDRGRFRSLCRSWDPETMKRAVRNNMPGLLRRSGDIPVAPLPIRETDRAVQNALYEGRVTNLAWQVR